MDDEILARATPLVGMVDARVHECVLDLLAVDRYRALVRVLLDDREQVGEQPPLGAGQFGPSDRGSLATVIDLVDGKMGFDRNRALVGRPFSATPALRLALDGRRLAGSPLRP